MKLIRQQKVDPPKPTNQVPATPPPADHLSAVQPTFLDQLEPLMRVPEVLRVLGISRSTLERLVRDGEIGPPVKIRKNIIAFRTRDVVAYVQSLKPTRVRTGQ